MILLPVIERELRAAARQSFTYILRLLGVGALLTMILFTTFKTGLPPGSGWMLFGVLHVTLLLATWVLVPLLAADSISREKREGTLQLLALTLLSPQDVVLAKGVVHGLRAFSLLLAVVPVLVIPMLVGGVAAGQAIISAGLCFASAFLALGAGLFASAFSRTHAQALAFTGAMAALSLLAFFFILGLGFESLLTPAPMGGDWFGRKFGFGVEIGLRGGFFMPANSWTGLGRAVRLASFATALCYSTAMMAVLFLILLRATAWATRKEWRHQPPSRTAVWFQDVFCRPIFFRKFFKSWMRRNLNKTPIGWLEHRTWFGRLVMWIWLAVVASVYSVAFTNMSFFASNFGGIQNATCWMLAGSIAICAAGSFRRERETGVLELLLVSPLTETQVIAGRLRGLWMQFMPAFLLLLFVWVSCAALPGFDLPALSIYHLSSFVSLPLIGLHFSLTSRSVIGTFVKTLLAGLLIPTGIRAFAGFLAWSYVPLVGSFGQRADQASWVAPLVQVGLAAYFSRRMRQCLKTRSFIAQTG